MKNAKTQMWLTLVVSFIVIGPALFIAAWSINYWQAWVFLAVVIILSVLYYALHRKRPETSRESDEGGRAATYPEDHRTLYRSSGRSRVHHSRA